MNLEGLHKETADRLPLPEGLDSRQHDKCYTSTVILMQISCVSLCGRNLKSKINSTAYIQSNDVVKEWHNELLFTWSYVRFAKFNFDFEAGTIQTGGVISLDQHITARCLIMINMKSWQCMTEWVHGKTKKNRSLQMAVTTVNPKTLGYCVEKKKYY